MCRVNRNDAITHPCFTSDFTVNLVVEFLRLSLCTLSNAFSKSTKLTKIFLCHSLHCSRMFRKAKMCSVVLLPFLKPACSGRRSLSTVVFIRVMMIF